MQFIKKNYEKVLLGLVLVGLVLVAVFLLFLVSNEKATLSEIRGKITQRTPKLLPEPDLTRVETLLRRGQTPLALNYSDPTNKLFNPERWQKPAPPAPLFKNPVGTELEKLEILRTPSLYLIFRLETVTQAESGTRYGVSVEQQAAAKPSQRGRRTFYVVKGDKKEYGERKETFTLLDIQGAAESPALVLELSDSNEKVTITRDKPYQRVDGFLADLKYPPGNQTFAGRREGNSIFIAGDEYIIVRILENEVILQGKNQKKWSKKLNPAP